MQTYAAIIGMGYVGLPLAYEAALSGQRVLGFDVDPSVVDSLNSGHSHIDDVDDAQIQHMRDSGFRATSVESDLGSAATVVVCVPTPLGTDGSPDLGFVTKAMEAVARNLRPGQLIILESTSWPGTTDELVRPILEASGLVVGSDIHLAFSPERVDPGNPNFGVKNTPKVVGGITPACTERAAEFYERFIDTVARARGTREAETAKLLENTYRHINIALVNEMARFCHDLDIDLWNVIDLASTKPFGFQPFYPGPGVGGHCIPIDPNYLSYTVRTRLGYPFRFVELAQEINDTMPAYVLRRIQDLLNDHGKALRGAQVLLLGVTYKRDIADQRESPAVPLAEYLHDHGADVRYHDPYVPIWSLDQRDLNSVASLDDAVASADLVVLVQNHSCYDLDHLVDRAHSFFDTRGATRTPGAHRL